MSSKNKPKYSDETVDLQYHKTLLKAAEYWVDGLEVCCNGRRGKLLGGHNAQCNSLYLRCMCPDVAGHEKNERSPIFSFDSWVFGHCMEDVTDNMTDQEIDAACLTHITVPSHGNESLRDVCRTTTEGYGGKMLSGHTVWVYWWDEPCPEGQEGKTLSRHERQGNAKRQPMATSHVSAKGGKKAARPDEDPKGVWYRAEVVGYEEATGQLHIFYHADEERHQILLPIVITHWGMDAPKTWSPSAVERLPPPPALPPASPDAGPLEALLLDSFNLYDGVPSPGSSPLLLPDLENLQGPVDDVWEDALSEHMEDELPLSSFLAPPPPPLHAPAPAPPLRAPALSPAPPTPATQAPVVVPGAQPLAQSPRKEGTPFAKRQLAGASTSIKSSEAAGGIGPAAGTSTTATAPAAAAPTNMTAAAEVGAGGKGMGGNDTRPSNSKAVVANSAAGSLTPPQSSPKSDGKKRKGERQELSPPKAPQAAKAGTLEQAGRAGSGTQADQAKEGAGAGAQGPGPPTRKRVREEDSSDDDVPLNQLLVGEKKGKAGIPSTADKTAAASHKAPAPGPNSSEPTTEHNAAAGSSATSIAAGKQVSATASKVPAERAVKPSNKPGASVQPVDKTGKGINKPATGGLAVKRAGSGKLGKVLDDFDDLNADAMPTKKLRTDQQAATAATASAAAVTAAKLAAVTTAGTAKPATSTTHVNAGVANVTRLLSRDLKPPIQPAATKLSPPAAPAAPAPEAESVPEVPPAPSNPRRVAKRALEAVSGVRFSQMKGLGQVVQMMKALYPLNMWNEVEVEVGRVPDAQLPLPQLPEATASNADARSASSSTSSGSKVPGGQASAVPAPLPGPSRALLHVLSESRLMPGVLVRPAAQAQGGSHAAGGTHGGALSELLAALHQAVLNQPSNAGGSVSMTHDVQHSSPVHMLLVPDSKGAVFKAVGSVDFAATVKPVAQGEQTAADGVVGSSGRISTEPDVASSTQAESGTPSIWGLQVSLFKDRTTFATNQRPPGASGKEREPPRLSLFRTAKLEVGAVTVIILYPQPPAARQHQPQHQPQQMRAYLRVVVRPSGLPPVPTPAPAPQHSKSAPHRKAKERVYAPPPPTFIAKAAAQAAVAVSIAVADCAAAAGVDCSGQQLGAAMSQSGAGSNALHAAAAHLVACMLKADGLARAAAQQAAAAAS